MRKENLPDIMFDFISVLILLLLILALGWLVLGAWRAKHLLIKWAGTILGSLLTLLMVAAAVTAMLGYIKLNRKYDNPVKQVKVQLTEQRIARGAKFAPICAECHAPESSSSLIGNDFMGEEAPPIGKLYAPNLTPVHLSAWSDGAPAHGAEIRHRLLWPT